MLNIKYFCCFFMDGSFLNESGSRVRVNTLISWLVKKFNLSGGDGGGG